MSSISKPDHCAERPNLVLLSAYQEYLMTFKLMTSQVVQRARPLSGRIWPLGRQRVNYAGIQKLESLYPDCFDDSRCSSSVL